MQGTVQRRVMHLDTRSAIACKHLRVRMAEGVVATAGDQHMLRCDGIDERLAG